MHEKKNENKLKLFISSLNEEFMVTCTREVLYPESCNPIVSRDQDVTGRLKRQDVAELRLRHSVLVSTVSHGEAGQ